jgi:hypothetical protein
MSIQPTPVIGDSNLAQTAVFPAELKATMTGSFTLIGTLTGSPVIVIFDNQGTAPVQIGVGPASATPTPTITTWRTFTAGEALVLDLRAQAGKAANFTLDSGTSFWGNGASGTFSISYLTAEP